MFTHRQCLHARRVESVASDGFKVTRLRILFKLFILSSTTFELNQNDEVREQSADEAEQIRPVDDEKSARNAGHIMVHLQAKDIASFQRFLVGDHLRVNYHDGLTSLGFDPTRNDDHPSAEPEEKQPVKSRNGVEDDLATCHVGRCQIMKELVEEENAENDELGKVVEEIDGEAFVDQVERDRELSVQYPNSFHKRDVQISRLQNVVHILKSLVDRDDDKHVVDFIAQVGRYIQRC